MPGVFAICLAAISLKPGGAATSHASTTSRALSGVEHFNYGPEARDFNFEPPSGGREVYVIFCHEHKELLREEMTKSIADGIVHFQAVFYGYYGSVRSVTGWMDVFESESGLGRQDKIDWKFLVPKSSWMKSNVHFKISTNPECDGSATKDNILNFVGGSKMIWQTHSRSTLMPLTEEFFLNNGLGVAAIYNTDAKAIACASIKKLDSKQLESLPNEGIKSVFAAHFVTDVKGAVVVRARRERGSVEWDIFLNLSGLDLRCANHKHDENAYTAENFACRVAFHPGRSCETNFDDKASPHLGMMHFPLQVEPVTASGDLTLTSINYEDKDDEDKDDEWHTYMNMFGSMFRAKDRKHVPRIGFLLTRAVAVFVIVCSLGYGITFVCDFQQVVARCSHCVQLTWLSRCIPEPAAERAGRAAVQLTGPIPNAFEKQVHQHNSAPTHGGPAN